MGLSDGAFFMIKHSPLLNGNHSISSPLCPMEVADNIRWSSMRPFLSNNSWYIWLKFSKINLHWPLFVNQFIHISLFHGEIGPLFLDEIWQLWPLCRSRKNGIRRDLTGIASTIGLWDCSEIRTTSYFYWASSNKEKPSLCLVQVKREKEEKWPRPWPSGALPWERERITGRMRWPCVGRAQPAPSSGRMLNCTDYIVHSTWS